MQAPSLLCLHALRRILSPNPTSINSKGHVRFYSQRPPPPPIPSSNPNHSSNRQQPTPDDDDSEHIPRPLSRPIGLPEPPQPGTNTGRDSRSLRKRHQDFTNYDRHLARRAQMTKEISKPYFRDWTNLKYSKGKGFVAPERLFRAETALFFPNFFGRTLRKGQARRDKQDGYRGLGRDTCEAMGGKVSVVSLVTSEWAQSQVESFIGSKENADLHRVLDESGGVAQQVDINYESNTLRYWILRLFGLGRLRAGRSSEQQERYFVVRRGLDDTLKDALVARNEKVGYVYLVDPHCKIRWAGCAVAEPQERESLVRGVRKLIQEAKGQRETRKEKLNNAVREVVGELEVEEAEKKSAAAG
jgi:mitochondrial ATPase complex subunit ATP10